MSRNTNKNINAATRAPFAKRFSVLNANPAAVDHDFDNAYPLTWSDSADLTSIEGIQVDSDGRIRIDQAARLGARELMQFNLSANGSLATQAFFIADRAMVVTGISEVHATAGSDAGSVTMQITHDTGTQAPGAGAVVQSNSFNLKGTANTVQSAALLSPTGTGSPATGLLLAAGDRLSAVFTGTLTALAGVVVTVAAAPGCKEQPAVYAMNANGSLATQSFFLANRDLQVVGVNMIWSAAGTDAGAVTIDVTKDTSTNVPGAGTSVLSAAVSAKTTANTVNSAALAASAATLQLAAGDRLAVKLTGTLTALAGVVVVVYFAPIYDRVEVAFTMNANSGQATQAFFIADRDYEVIDFSEVHATAGSDAGAVTLDCTIDKGTAAPGAGTTCLAGTCNLKATANTVIIPGVATALRNRLLKAGDRLSVKYTGTLTALAGVTATASLAVR
jgi:hypothetical protein